MDSKIRIMKRGEDGNRLITVRMKESTFERLSEVSIEVNRSRNEVINAILEQGLDNLEIQCDTEKE